jgi:hydrogenase maturation protease
VTSPTDGTTPPRVVVVGVGNAHRSDDAAGLAAARRLADLLPADVHVAAVPGGLTALLEAWEGAAAVVLVDAVRSGAPAGTVHRHDASARPLPATLATTSTHGLGLPQAIEIARKLGALPPRVLVWGVEGRSFQPGATLSREVAEALPALVERVCAEVAALRAEGGPAAGGSGAAAGERA